MIKAIGQYWKAYIVLLLLVLIQFFRNDISNGYWFDYFASAKNLHFPLTFDSNDSIIFSNITWLRFFIEYFRQPDAHLGFVWMSFSLGQVLSGLMIIGGVFLSVYIHRRKNS